MDIIYDKSARGEVPKPIGYAPGHEPSEEHVNGLSAKPFWEVVSDGDDDDDDDETTKNLFPWAKDLEAKMGEPVRLVFDYRQAATGRAVRRMEVDLPGTRKGAVEFQVIGEQYLKSGRVLAWKLEFYRGGKLVETHRSYLWD